MTDPPDPVLCLVKDCWAYFTTQPLAAQRGSDWDDSPYELNASAPDEPGAGETWQISRVAGDWDRLCLDPPTEVYAGRPWSVQEVNAGGIPWLRSASYSDHLIALWAGTPLSEFIRQIESIGGVVYLPHRPGGL